MVKNGEIPYTGLRSGPSPNQAPDCVAEDSAGNMVAIEVTEFVSSKAIAMNQLGKDAFADSQRIIAEDVNHGKTEMRYYCFGKVGDGILTVRFTYRNNVIRIIGAGYWRKGKAIYEHENKIHR